jgi:hypothetical protein
MFIKNGRQERRTGGDGSQKPVEPGPERDLREARGAAIVEVDVIRPRQARAARRQRRLAWAWIGLATATRALRDRRFEAALITGALVLVAAAELSWESLVRDISRLIALDDRRPAKPEEKSRRRG